MDKLALAITQSPYQQLLPDHQQLVRQLSTNISMQRIRQLIIALRDLEMWQEEITTDLASIMHSWQEKKKKRSYLKSQRPKVTFVPPQVQKIKNLGLGRCPVASLNTRCCNLTTIDLVQNCPFACSYCALPEDHTIYKVDDLERALHHLPLHDSTIYHLGSGQASDSLAVLSKDDITILSKFLKKRPNIIFEFKSKSDCLDILDQELSKNMIFTWSISGESIFTHEEHLTAPPHRRIQAAYQLSKRKILTGFHLHPLILHDQFYAEINCTMAQIKKIDPQLIAMISLGTLTYTPKTIASIRRKKLFSKVLQMPLTKIASKYSYPLPIKEKLFKYIYQSFSSWHQQLFFYLCMEDISLWDRVFNYSYASNEQFEQAMQRAYLQKIQYVQTL